MSERHDIINESLKKIQDHSSYFRCNKEKLEIFDGDLQKYVEDILSKTVSPNYYKHIQQRMIPINVLTRVIDKMSKVYSDDPIRLATNDSALKWVEETEATSSMNTVMGMADSYSHLFKGYLLQPYIDNSKIQLRVIPYDRFLPLALDNDKPEKMTALLTYMGKTEDHKKIYYYYDDDRFIPFTEDGNLYSKALAGNDGVNPYGFIPFVYGNRSLNQVVPTQDTDILQISKMIPVFLTDLGGAALFQCFSIMYGVNVEADNLEMSPNAFWNLKSDNTSDIPPQIGTIKPEVDIDKVKSFIKDIFVLWLETKGVRVGSIGSMDAGNVASGISKIIDEMDVYEIKKRQIQFFKKEEYELWEKLVALNNTWSKAGKIDSDIVPDDTKVITEFDEPRPEVPRETEVKVVNMEVEGGYLDKMSAIKRLYPDLTNKQIMERLDLIENDKVTIELGNGADKDDN